MSGNSPEGVHSLLGDIYAQEVTSAALMTHLSVQALGGDHVRTASWLRSEALAHLERAAEAGEMIRRFHAAAPLRVDIAEPAELASAEIPRRALEAEQRLITLSKELLQAADGVSLSLQGFARRSIAAGEFAVEQLSEVEKSERSFALIIGG